LAPRTGRLPSAPDTPDVSPRLPPGAGPGRAVLLALRRHQPRERHRRGAPRGHRAL